MRRRGIRGLCLVALAFAPVLAHAQARIAIIIDDLGYNRASGVRVLQLPGPVACSFIPDAPFSAEQAEVAFELDKEVMLHIPMQPHAGARAHPNTLTINSSADDVRHLLRTAMLHIPHAVGLNNHQGSLLTERSASMRWLMDAMDAYPQLYFVDSMTSPHSVALNSARAAQIPSTRRNVFLDHDPRPEAIDAQFDRLVRHARRHGTALAIGHPYDETLDVLERRLPALKRQGIQIVAVSDLIHTRMAQRDDQGWRVSLRLGDVPTATTPDRMLQAAN